MKRVMSITAVLAAVTCHSAYGQLDGIGSAAQSAAGQVGSAADPVSNQVQSQAGDVQANAAADANVGANANSDVGANANADVGSNSGIGANTGVEANTNLGPNAGVGANAAVDNTSPLNTDANANAGTSGVAGQANVNASSSNLNTTGQAGVRASTQNQLNRGTRNLNRAIGGIVPQIPQQARAGNSGPYDARWRFTQRNGQWWYYSPQNQWMVRQNDQWQNYNDTNQPLAGGNLDQSAYSSGYRGEMNDQGQYPNPQPYQDGYGNAGMGQMQMTGHTGQVYMLRHDQSGREYICVQGQRVYFDDQPAGNMGDQPMDNQPPKPGSQTDSDQIDSEPYESGRQNLDATDADDQRSLTEPQANTEAADATETDSPPAPIADSPADTSDDDSEESEQSNDADSETDSDSDDAGNDDADNDEA